MDLGKTSSTVNTKFEKEELEKVSGIEGLTFCHTARFIVSCRDLNTVYGIEQNESEIWSHDDKSNLEL